MDPGKIFQIITNSTLLATRLLSGAGGAGPLQFSEPRYCLLLAEDAPPALRIAQVTASHKDGVGVRYSIRAGNRDGLFTIDQHTGLITLAAPLDYELHAKHELVVAAEAEGHTAHAIVHVTIADVNDNEPHFLEKDLQVTVVEEEDARHLPAAIIKVVAEDPDTVDQEGLVYSVGGEGVDAHSPSDAYFTINPHTGDLLLLRALDRDPPLGRGTWKVKVQVRDGQWMSPSMASVSRHPRVSQGQYDLSQDTGTLSRPPGGTQGQYDLSQDTGTLSRPPGGTQGQYDLAQDTGTLSRPPGGTQGQYDLAQDTGTLSRPPGGTQGQYDLTQDTGTLSRPPGGTQGQHDLAQDTGTLSRPPGGTQAQYDLAQDTGTLSRPPGSTQGQYDLAQDAEELQKLNFISQDPILPPKDRSVASSAPRDYSDGHFLSQEPNLREQDEYLLLQDPRRPKNRHSLTQGHFEPHGIELQVKDEEETEEQDEDNLKTDGRQKRRGQKKERDVPISGNKQVYFIYERDETNVKETSELSSRNEMENLTSKAPGKREDFTQKRRRTSGKKRKLRDNNHRHTKEDMSGDAKPNDAGRILELPSISPHSDYGFQIGSHKTLHKFIPANWNNDESLEFSRDHGDQHFQESVHTEDKPERQRLLRPRYIMHRKHQQFGARRRLLSVRGFLKSEAPQSYFEDETIDANQKVSGILEPERCHKVNATLSMVAKPSMNGVEERPYSLREPPGTRGNFNRRTHATESAPMDGSHEVSDDKYCENLSALSTASTATSTRSERDSTSGASGNVEPEEGGREAKAVGATLSKREVEDPLPQHGLPLDQEPLKQFSEDRRYVRGFTADGGGCQDRDVFSISSEEQFQHEMAHMLDMRRERVHVAETVVTVVVKDVNDNAPVFPNVTIYGEVQENGPIDLSAGVVWAWDADDQQEGTNAHLTYSIEKNVVDERSGQAIFAVHPETGLVRTAVCCLDRETTPEYHIQVVATDGGGLKGTGTVVVRLVDVNDNSPRLTRDLWQVEVDETWGHGAPRNDTLLQVSTADHDTSNYFFYRVVEGSGWGWQHFGMRTEGTVGQLFARQTLDFEDAAHRRGFRFMIQVTDRGRGGWSDARHTDTAWVEVRLRDLNDNPPQFRRPHAHVTVREDAAPGTLLVTLPATDPDMMKQQGVEYRVEGGWGALSVDGSGGVRLWRALDREAPGGEVGVARVVAVDEGGRPSSLSSTATLTITVTDVNDCPPRLLPPTLLHVTEGAPASLLGLLTATDDDVWALAHGPPFNFTLAPTNPAHVLDTLSIKYDSSIDSGRGGAEVWTLGPVDREEHRQLTAEVVVADAGGLAATQPVTVIIDDVNDNPMKPAAKTVYLWKTRGGGADAALGRVYVEDPDDWDLQDKTFSWAGPPNPLFTLQPNTGEIFASTQLMEGRYELHFSVSDRVWGQKDVAAKVTVGVKYLSPEAVAHAVPLTLTPTTPATLATGWTPTLGGGGLGTLIEAVMHVLRREAEAVEIISVHGLPDLSTPPVPISHRPSSSSSSDTSLVVPVMPAPPHLACVWLSVKQIGGSFMDPVKLHGLLALHLQYLEKVMNLRVAVEDMHTVEGKNEEATSSYSASSPSDTTSLASVALPLQVVDTNLTSLVTPRLMRASDCHTLAHYRDNTCTPTSCLNGGRCIRTDIGNRCVCPGWSWGPHCKVLARTFTGSGWAWVQPLPPCLPTTLSLRLLTLHKNAIIFYSGPLSTTTSHPHYPPMPMMTLQLVNGQPQVLLEGARGPIKLQVAVTVNTGTWHTIHLQLSAQGVTLMVDLCGRGWGANTTNDAHCIARAPWLDAQVTESWGSSAPLQLGGLAHTYPQSADYGWSNAIVNQALDGCISHLTVNGELIDLGEPAYSSGSVKNCRPQEIACRDKLGSCGLRGHCVDGLNNPRCDCLPGWAGPECAVPTIPAALSHASYMRVALSFKPNPYDLSLQLRVRTLGRPSGLLVRLAASQQSHALTLHLRGGVACALVSGMEWTAQEACLEGFPLGNGLWHTLQVSRHGHNLIISVDDGDGWRRNETLTSLLTTTSLGDLQAVVTTPPMPIYVDNQHGTTVGGIPEFVGLSPKTVHDDLRNSCIDDVRVSGHPLPLPPSVNGTSWGQVTSQQNFEQGCPTPDFCTNTTCFPPLSCHNSWRHATCSCEPGQQLVGLSCQDIDECVYQPCLHGGTCHNLKPGYVCTCGPAHIGDNCEWAKISLDLHPLTAPIAIAALTLFILVIVVIGVLLNIRFQRSRAARGMAERPGDVEGVAGTLGTSVESQVVIESHPAAKEENIVLESLMIRIPKNQVPQTPEGRKHLVTSLGVSTLESETKAIRDISVQMPGTTMIVPAREIDKNQESANPRRCSTASVNTTTLADAVTEHRKNTSPTLCYMKTHTTTECPSRAQEASCAQPLLAQDDLRAYAYEGDGSPSGSLTSSVVGLRTESLEDENLNPLVPEYREVFDLLKNLPDANNHSSNNESCESPTSKLQTGVNIT
ncbi:uncharacterized protein [Panulirus ornatus]|uniref:uncharacterized protein isoform X3 n=1 Tax=Panulirus ornatus TaxID=150431 RepID=UPI003A861FDA